MKSDQLGILEDSLIKLEAPTNDAVDQVIRKLQPKDVPRFSLEPHLELINRCFSAETYEGILENLTKDGSEFANAQLKELHKMVILSDNVSNADYF